MRRSRRVRREGTAWLVADRQRGDYACYRYVGRHGDHLAERARQPTAEQALAWARARTTRVRIRTTEARTYWAGTAPRPDGFSCTWPEPPADVPDKASAPIHGVEPTAPIRESDDTTSYEARPMAPVAAAAKWSVPFMVSVEWHVADEKPRSMPGRPA